MTHPLFQVDEEVDLVCNTYPQGNGTYTIVKIAYIPEPVKSNDGSNSPIGWFYMLHHDTENVYHESAIRKRFKRSNQSYSELIESLKDNKPHHWLEDIKIDTKKGGIEDE